MSLLFSKPQTRSDRNHQMGPARQTFADSIASAAGAGRSQASDLFDALAHSLPDETSDADSQIVTAKQNSR